MNELRKVVKKLRLATTLVKLLPFVCAAFYIICLITYLWGSDAVLFYVDSLFYISPLMVGVIWILGAVFECCKWHRLQCAILLMPTIASYLDVWFDFSAIASWINWATLSVVVVGSLYNAYRMFWQDGQTDE
jgi:hypothetical protein